MGEKKLTVTQGGTQTCDLANDLPCSNQLSYWVTWQLSGQIRVLNAELPGIQSKQISSWYIQWGGCSECEAQGAWHSDINMLQTWPSDLSLSQIRKKEIRRKKWGKRNWQWLREGLDSTTWQMACHALTNWATESLGNSVAEFKYLRLSCQGSSQSGYQPGMFDGEGAASAKCEAHDTQILTSSRPDSQTVA